MKNLRGFTLIETILTIVIIGIGLFGMMVLFDSASRGSMEADINLAATYLAQERLEQLIADKHYRGYSYVDNSNYTDDTDWPVTVGNHNFRRTFRIYEVNRGDLSTVGVGSGYKRINMTIAWGAGAGESLTFSTLVTNY